MFRLCRPPRFCCAILISLRHYSQRVTLAAPNLLHPMSSFYSLCRYSVFFTKLLHDSFFRLSLFGSLVANCSPFLCICSSFDRLFLLYYYMQHQEHFSNSLSCTWEAQRYSLMSIFHTRYLLCSVVLKFQIYCNRFCRFYSSGPRCLDLLTIQTVSCSRGLFFPLSCFSSFSTLYSLSFCV